MSGEDVSKIIQNSSSDSSTLMMTRWGIFCCDYNCSCYFYDGWV